MNFEEFWSKLQSELAVRREFETLKQKKGFEAYFERNTKGELKVCVIPQGGIPRSPIPSNEFRGIWDVVKEYSPETRFENKDGRLGSYQTKKGETGESMQVSYILRLIKHIVENQEMS